MDGRITSEADHLICKTTLEVNARLRFSILVGSVELRHEIRRILARGLSEHPRDDFKGLAKLNEQIPGICRRHGKQSNTRRQVN